MLYTVQLLFCEKGNVFCAKRGILHSKKGDIQPKNMDITRIIYHTITNYITIHYNETRVYNKINVGK